MLAALAAEDQGKEQPVAVRAGDVALALQGQVAGGRRIQRAVDGTALGDKLMQLEGEAGRVFGVPHRTAKVEEAAQLGRAVCGGQPRLRGERCSALPQRARLGAA